MPALAPALTRKTDHSPAEASGPEVSRHGFDQSAGIPLFLQRRETAGAPPSQPEALIEEEEEELAAIQTKLVVNTPGDSFEQEADAVAQLASRAGSARPGSSSPISSEHEPLLQRKIADSRLVDSTTNYDQQLPRPDSGSSLSDTVRSRVEPVVGADLGTVRVHTSPAARQTAKALGARAFTHFNHIWLGPGESSQDVELMAHESAHVVQQSQERARPSPIQRKEASPQLIADNESRQQEMLGASAPSRVESPDRAQATQLTEPRSPPPPAQPPPAAPLPAPPPPPVPLPPLASTAPSASAREPNATPVSSTPATPDAQSPGLPGAPAGLTSARDTGPVAPIPAVPADVPALGEVLSAPAFADPGMMAAAERIRAVTATEKEAALHAFDARRAAIQSSVAAAVQAIEAEGENRAQQLETELQQKEQEVGGRFGIARAAITAALETQCAAARADEVAAVADLQQAIADKRRAATAASEQEALAVEAVGGGQADRARGIVRSTNSSIDAAAGRAVSETNAPDGEVRGEVETKVEESSGAIKGDIQEKGDNVTRGSIETSQTVAGGIREAGTQLAGSIDEGAADVERSIHEGTAGVIEQIQLQAQESLTRLVEGERQFAAGLAHIRVQIVPGIRSATQEAVQRMEQLGQQAIAGIDTGCASAGSAFDQAFVQVLGQFSAASGEDVPTGGAAALDQRVQRKEQPGQEEVSALNAESTPAASEFDTETFEQQATALFRQLRTEITTDLDQQVTQIIASIDQALAGFGQALERYSGEILQRVDQALGEIRDIEHAPQTFVERCQEGRGHLQQERQRGIHDWGNQADGKITEAQGEWTARRSETEEEIRGRVDEFQTQTTLVGQNAPEQFHSAATRAVTASTGSLGSRIWAGIREGFSRFFDGMKWFLLIFLAVFVVVVVVMAVIAGGISMAVIAAAAALALLIVGIGFLIYGLVMSAIHRIGQWMAAPQPWWAKIICIPYLIAVIVGDVLGVTPILEGAFGYDAISLEELSTEERWARVTLGVLTIATFLLLRRAGKAASARGRGWRTSVPRTEPPVADPTAPREPLPPERTVPEPPRYDPTGRTPGELVGDTDPTPRPGETPEQARARSEAARAEQARRAYCFVAGTRVQTPDGAIPIEMLAPGQLVLGKGGDDSVAPYSIIDCIHGSTLTLFHVEIAGTLRLATTPNHPFFVVGKGWTAAKALAVGDNLIALNGTVVSLTGICCERLNEPLATFNIHVEAAHSYFAGDVLAVWVHNGDPNDPKLGQRLFWGLGASGPRQRLPRPGDPTNPNPRLQAPDPGDIDGASAWRTSSADEAGRFLGARQGEGGTGNHGAITEAQLASQGLVAVETPGEGAAAEAGLQHVSIRPATNPDPSVPLSDAEMADVKAKLEQLQPEVKAKPKDFGCG